MSDRTTSIEEIIQLGIDSAFKNLHTCLPAVVTRFDSTNQLIDCQVTLKRKLNNELVLLPKLVNVPIRYPKSTTFSITFPIEVDDHVLLIFSERSIDTWLEQGGIRDPFDVRKHSLSDAFAFPMMYPQTDTIPSFDATNLEIKTNSGNTKIILNASEGIKIETSQKVEVDATDNVEVYGAEIHLNGDSDTAIAFTDMKVAFDLLRTELNALVTAYNTHVHTVAGGTGVPTTPTTPGVPAVADMSGAEVPTVKVP